MAEKIIYSAIFFILNKNILKKKFYNVRFYRDILIDEIKNLLNSILQRLSKC